MNLVEMFSIVVSSNSSVVEVSPDLIVVRHSRSTHPKGKTYEVNITILHTAMKVKSFYERLPVGLVAAETFAGFSFFWLCLLWLGIFLFSVQL